MSRETDRNPPAELSKESEKGETEIEKKWNEDIINAVDILEGQVVTLRDNQKNVVLNPLSFIREKTNNPDQEISPDFVVWLTELNAEIAAVRARLESVRQIEGVDNFGQKLFPLGDQEKKSLKCLEDQQSQLAKAKHVMLATVTLLVMFANAESEIYLSGLRLWLRRQLSDIKKTTT